MQTRVLVVDDDSDLRTMCTSILRTAGIKVFAAESAEVGLGILEREACDVAILDVKLPGMNGLDALGVIAAKWPTLPVLLATATGDAGEAEVRARGARGLLTKPFSADELVAGIKKALAWSGAAGQSGGRPERGSGGRRGAAKRRPDTVQEIVLECDDVIEGLRAELPRLRKLGHDQGFLDGMFRRACAAKGLIDFLDLAGLTDAASWLAGWLRRLRDGEAAVTGEVLAEIDGILGRLLDMLSGLRGDVRSPGRITHAPLPAVLAGTAAPEESALAAAQGAGGLVAELGRSLPRVFSGLGARGVECREVVQRRISRSSSALTVAVDIEMGSGRKEGLPPSGPSVFAAVFEFEPESARSLAEAFTTFMLAEPISGPPEEQTEFVEGALGEMVNRAVSGMAPAVDFPFRASGPYFFREAGTKLCALPQTLLSFQVESDLGGFEAGILTGAVLMEEDAGRVEREPPGRRGKVLVVHHSAVMRKMFRRTFEGTGYEIVAEAADGRRAVETFRTVRPDLVVLALNMPGMGGLDALRIIRTDDPGARVLICSAVTEARAIRESLHAGAVGYFTTPFEPGQLVQMVESLFQTRASPRSAVPDELDVPALGIYRVVEFLADGGMADVYKACDPGLGREVALKVLKDKFARDVDFVVRFLNEARAVASINHPNVVSIYFAGSDRGKHFFAMEFLPGPDLEYLIERDNVILSEYNALEYISQAAGGLAAANRRGIVHCDVKPSNLVLGADGVLKVTDFGIARQMKASNDCGDSGPFGTPEYASPEQATGAQVDHRSDIYSLGATLYFLVAGAPPYEGKDDMELVLRHVHDPVPRLRGASRRVNKLLARMMAKSPDARHATYEELIADVARLV